MSKDSRAPGPRRRSRARLIWSSAVALAVIGVIVGLGCSGSVPGWNISAWTAETSKQARTIPATATAGPGTSARPTTTPTPMRSPSPTPKATSVPTGKPGMLARSMMIPSLGIASQVAEVSTTYDAKGNLVWQTVPFLIGHFSGASNPGQLGNAIFSGHLTSQHAGSIFKRLPEIGLGAGIIFTAGDTNYLYRVVDKQVVEPSDLGALRTSNKSIATLITCVPDGIYNQRLVVTAEYVGPPPPSTTAQ